ncbi:MAG TPA: tetratricopeptide repeat protein [Actinomycetota bacterium]|nr:tetratricopeptide repeat protein [Actinomycetota bacterium]
MSQPSDLPTGTVTFLFSDIEGSTRMLQHLGPRYAAVLEEHYRLLREAVERNGGFDMGAEGDSLMAAFPTAAGAVACALDGQRALLAWDVEPPVRVRMGIHTGDVDLTPGGYVGLTVHQAARICSAAHGGQVLMSESTRQLVGQMPAEVSLRDVGSHRLKDLDEPQRLYQLGHPELPSDLPPPRSLDAGRTNLPARLSSFIGREAELEKVREMLAGSRLVTLTGVGGCGKTRLALEAAASLSAEFADGVWLVELAGVSDPDKVAAAVAAPLGVREEPGRPVAETLQSALLSQSLLIVLDNCEHLIGGSAGLAEALLTRCPDVRILATSREALEVRGEAVWTVPSLAVPSEHATGAVDIESTESVLLFSDRAKAANAGFELNDETAHPVADICRRLEGVPLALELAAARVRAMPVEQVAARLGDFFRMLTGGSRTALERHQTLRATIDWSYDLLDEREQAALMRLSVFVGGFTMDAAEAVCAGVDIGALDVLDLVSALISKSLVSVDADGRHRLLETIRQYALEKLVAAREVSEVRARHRDWCVDLAERAEPHLTGRDQAHWVQQLEAELDNIRAALEWSLGQDEGLSALRMSAALTQFWRRDRWSEGNVWIDRSLDAAPDAPLEWLARACEMPGRPAVIPVDADQSTLRLERALAIYRDLGDRAGESRCLMYMSYGAAAKGDYRSADELSRQSLETARATGDPADLVRPLTLNIWGIRWKGSADTAALSRELRKAMGQSKDPDARISALKALASLEPVDRPDSEADALLGEAVSLAEESGSSWRTADVLLSRGIHRLNVGDHSSALADLERSVRISQRMGEHEAVLLSLLAWGWGLLCARGPDAAEEVFLRALAASEASGTRVMRAICLCDLAVIHLLRGRPDEARVVAERALELYRNEASEEIGLSDAQLFLGWLDLQEGNVQSARSRLQLALDVGERYDIPRFTVESLCGLAWLDALHGEEGSRLQARQALGHARNFGPSHLIWTLRALECFFYVESVFDPSGSAVIVAAAAEAARRRYGEPLVPWVREKLANALSRCRDRLGDLEFDRSWARGSTMWLAETFDLVLGPESLEPDWVQTAEAQAEPRSRL